MTTANLTKPVAPVTKQNSEDDRKVIEKLGEVLAGSGWPLVVASGTASPGHKPTTYYEQSQPYAGTSRRRTRQCAKNGKPSRGWPALRSQHGLIGSYSTFYLFNAHAEKLASQLHPGRSDELSFQKTTAC